MVKTKRLSDYKSGITIPDDYYTTGFVDGTNYSFPVSALYTYMWEGSATNLESLYTTVRQNSSVFTTVQQNSSVFSVVQANSGSNWSYQGTDIKSLTGKWQSTSSIVSANSAALFGNFYDVDVTHLLQTSALDVTHRISFSDLLIYNDVDVKIESGIGLSISSDNTKISGIPTSNQGPGIMWYDEGTSSFKMGT